MKKKPVRAPRKKTSDKQLDQRLFELDGAQMSAFLKALNKPARPNARLKKLMVSKSPWEKRADFSPSYIL